GGRYDLAVRAGAGRLDDPAVAVPRPEALGAAAVGVVDPGLDLPGARVPADALDAGDRDLPPDLGGERPDQCGPVLGPLAARLHLAMVALVEPIADQPLELLEVLARVGGGRALIERGLAEIVLEPTAVPLDVGHGVVGALRGRGGVGRRGGRGPLLDGGLPAEEPEGLDADRQRLARGLARACGGVPGERVAALDALAPGPDDPSFVGEQRREGRRLAGVISLRQFLDQPLQGALVFGAR